MSAQNEKIIYLSKVKLLLLIAGSIAFVFLGVWVANLDAEKIQSSRRYTDPVLVHLIGWVTVIFAVLCSAIGVKKFFDKRPGLILSSLGVTDNSSGTSAGFIPWEDISGFGIYKIKRQKMLTILLINPEKYIHSGGTLKVALKKISHQMSGSPILITSNSLKISFETLQGICNEYFEKYGSSV